MRNNRGYLHGFLQLGRLDDPEERKAVWRQSMATLASLVAANRAVPLEGLNPEALVASVHTALHFRLVDDLDFLSPAAASAALYELAAAIPHGEERRLLGRDVLKRLYAGDAPTFVALATLLALGSSRALTGPRIRARVALALDLPLGAGTNADGLALALISRREVARDWLTTPSTGSLPSRRLAARLLERAAREAARRHAAGDESGLRVFESEPVGVAWSRLLADRESLVWRHVATARGLLAHAQHDLAQEIDHGLSANLTPTEWRRSAASLGAMLAFDPEGTTKRALTFLNGPVFSRDHGIAGAMMFGIPRAAEAEPGAADELLTTLVAKGGHYATEVLLDIRRERLGAGFGQEAVTIARDAVARRIADGEVTDDGELALLESMASELVDGEPDGNTLRGLIAQALMAFAERGAHAAAKLAQKAVDVADGTLGMLELSRTDEAAGRRNAFRALRELDLGLMETSALGDLLTLERTDVSGRAVLAPLDDFFERLSDWLIAREVAPLTRAGSVPNLTLRMRQMRGMLHLVDADGSYGDERSGKLRDRRLRAASTLLRRVRLDAPTPLERVVCAATTRALDALIRDEVGEVSDILIAAATNLHNATQLRTFAEASMVPDVVEALHAYAALDRIVHDATDSGHATRACLDGLLRLATELPVASSPRVEALRSGLLQFVRALEAVAAAGSLEELAEGTDGTLLAPLETATHGLAQLTAGARRRLQDDRVADAPASAAAIRMLDFAVERAIRGNRDELDDALDAAALALLEDLPTLVAEAATVALRRVGRMPVRVSHKIRGSFLPAPPREAPLPPWMPPARVLGGFYVLRALGSGAVGSVFVARRSDERSSKTAELFALKVPDYDGAAARTLSEEEFLQLFRQEAGALLSLPTQENLANFVTFDAGARPKPILVMELVEGPTLERTIAMGDLAADRSFELLDGIAAGLEAMHSVGIGHLDVKPSNVILRDPDGLVGPAPPAEPVLVDFGLAGRHVRPGCATGEYGAPEIWGLGGNGTHSAPQPADVYAFGCLAYEVLTGKTLFDGPSEAALISAHVSHDGRPPGIESLLADRGTQDLGEVLSAALRRDPRQRVGISALREMLREVGPRLRTASWPLPS